MSSAGVDSRRNNFVIKSTPSLALSMNLPSKLVPLPVFKRHISFLKEMSSQDVSQAEKVDMPTFSGSVY